MNNTCQEPGTIGSQKRQVTFERDSERGGDTLREPVRAEGAPGRFGTAAGDWGVSGPPLATRNIRELEVLPVR